MLLNKKMKDFKQNVDFFIKNSKSFFEDSNLENIDNKHQKVIKKAYESIKSDFNINKVRNWEGQSDQTNIFKSNYVIDFILGIIEIKNSFISKFLNKLRFKTLSFIDIFFEISLMHDDIEILENVGGKKLLEDNPQNKTMGSINYKLIKGYSVSNRWIRYLYILNQILSKNLINGNDIWVDIGSFYGGLQGLVKKYKPMSRIVMVDFHHQLLRSYVYLKEMYPDAQHILPNSIENYSSFSELPDGCIVYVPVNEFFKISDYKCDLISNFYSFGEMKREYFNNYYSSNLLKSSKHIYLVNRFISSPFFEKTYDSDLTYNDYIVEKRKPIHFDIFPMGHYLIIRRNLLNRNFYRNISSSYFEIIY